MKPKFFILRVRIEIKPNSETEFFSLRVQVLQSTVPVICICLQVNSPGNLRLSFTCRLGDNGHNFFLPNVCPNVGLFWYVRVRGFGAEAVPLPDTLVPPDF